METKTIEVHLDQPSLNDLLSFVAAGSEIILTKDDTPFAKIIPLQPLPQVRVAGLHIGAVQMADDFDEPLPDDFWIGEE